MPKKCIVTLNGQLIVKGKPRKSVCIDKKLKKIFTKGDLVSWHSMKGNRKTFGLILEINKLLIESGEINRYAMIATVRSMHGAVKSIFLGDLKLEAKCRQRANHIRADCVLDL